MPLVSSQHCWELPESKPWCLQSRSQAVWGSAAPLALPVQRGKPGHGTVGLEAVVTGLRLAQEQDQRWQLWLWQGTMAEPGGTHGSHTQLLPGAGGSSALTQGHEQR